MTDLGSLDGGRSHGYEINDKGQVVGVSSYDAMLVQEVHAVLWDSNSMTDLGTLAPSHVNSVAWDINNSGQIVGDSFHDNSSIDRGAFLYENGVMINLNDLLAPGSNWVLLGSTAINDRGQIVGFGQHDGETRAFLMTPLPADVLPGDFDEDGNVDLVDFATMSAAWSGDETPTSNWNEDCDLDGSGVIDMGDLVIFVGNWQP